MVPGLITILQVFSNISYNAVIFELHSSSFCSKKSVLPSFVDDIFDGIEFLGRKGFFTLEQ